MFSCLKTKEKKTVKVEVNVDRGVVDHIERVFKEFLQQQQKIYHQYETMYIENQYKPVNDEFKSDYLPAGVDTYGDFHDACNFAQSCFSPLTEYFRSGKTPRASDGFFQPHVDAILMIPAIKSNLAVVKYIKEFAEKYVNREVNLPALNGFHRRFGQ